MPARFPRDLAFKKRKPLKKRVGRALKIGVIGLSLISPHSQRLEQRNANGTRAKTAVEHKIPDYLSESRKRIERLYPEKSYPEIKGFYLKYNGQRLDLGKHISNQGAKFFLASEIVVLVPKLILRESGLKPNAVASRSISDSTLAKGLADSTKSDSTKTNQRKITGVGLMQVSPESFELAKRNGVRVKNILDPLDSITAGIWMLSFYYRRLANEIPHFYSLPEEERARLTVTAYNYGLEKVLNREITRSNGYVEFIIHADSTQALDAHKNGTLGDLFDSFKGKGRPLKR